ncbi:MAG: nucleotide sugar dehydrogenase [Candidatus Marinimicrobia bacterium]|nr:nucleotide sugar dehydrogenase [Candidatus Neomarinimicrobiota bacterium]
MKIKKICCIGAGYVGGPTMAVIALKCPDIDITLVDINKDKIDAWNGPIKNLPVYEPGLGEIVKKTRNKNLFFSTDIKNEIESAQMIFMAVNTPTKTEGEGAGMAADLKYFIDSAKTIAESSKTDKIIIEKSTLPVRTAEKVKEVLFKYNQNNVHFEILSNPEFLAEGTAIQDLFKSDRVLIGGDNTKEGKEAVKALKKIYLRWIPKNKILTTNVWSSELAKLASNAMLAQRISSINSLSALCEKTGADIQELSKAIGMDKRIGSKFLNASVGFGGSCFQKDILNLVYLCRYYGLHEVAEFWHQVVKINNYQKDRFANKIIHHYNTTNSNLKIALLGWSFKKDTNDSRESASIYIANKLIQNNISINIYDPMVDSETIIKDLKLISKNNFEASKISIFKSIEESLLDVNSVVILTEWDEFRKFEWKKIKKRIKIFDGRLLIDKKNLSSHEYYCIGKSIL